MKREEEDTGFMALTNDSPTRERKKSKDAPSKYELEAARSRATVAARVRARENKPVSSKFHATTTSNALNLIEEALDGVDLAPLVAQEGPDGPVQYPHHNKTENPNGDSKLESVAKRMQEGFRVRAFLGRKAESALLHLDMEQVNICVSPLPSPDEEKKDSDFGPWVEIPMDQVFKLEFGRTGPTAPPLHPLKSFSIAVENHGASSSSSRSLLYYDFEAESPVEKDQLVLTLTTLLEAIYEDEIEAREAGFGEQDDFDDDERQDADDGDPYRENRVEDKSQSSIDGPLDDGGDIVVHPQHQDNSLREAFSPEEDDDGTIDQPIPCSPSLEIATIPPDASFALPTPHITETAVLQAQSFQRAGTPPRPATLGSNELGSAFATPQHGIADVPGAVVDGAFESRDQQDYSSRQHSCVTSPGSYASPVVNQQAEAAVAYYDSPRPQAPPPSTPPVEARRMHQKQPFQEPTPLLEYRDDHVSMLGRFSPEAPDGRNSDGPIVLIPGSSRTNTPDRPSSQEDVVSSAEHFGDTEVVDLRTPDLISQTGVSPVPSRATELHPVPVVMQRSDHQMRGMPASPVVPGRLVVYEETKGGMTMGQYHHSPSPTSETLRASLRSSSAIGGQTQPAPSSTHQKGFLKIAGHRPKQTHSTAVDPVRGEEESRSNHQPAEEHRRNPPFVLQQRRDTKDWPSFRTVSSFSEQGAAPAPNMSSTIARSNSLPATMNDGVSGTTASEPIIIDEGVERREGVEGIYQEKYVKRFGRSRYSKHVNENKKLERFDRSQRDDVPASTTYETSLSGREERPPAPSLHSKPMIDFAPRSPQAYDLRSSHSQQLVGAWCSDDVCTTTFHDMAQTCTGMFEIKQNQGHDPSCIDQGIADDQMNAVQEYVSNALEAPSAMYEYFTVDTIPEEPGEEGEANYSARVNRVQNRASLRNGQAGRYRSLRKEMTFTSSLQQSRNQVYIKTTQSFNDAPPTRAVGRNRTQDQTVLKGGTVFQSPKTPVRSPIGKGEEEGVAYYDSDPEDTRERSFHQRGPRRVSAEMMHTRTASPPEQRRAHGFGKIRNRLSRKVDEELVKEIVQVMQNDRLTLMWHPTQSLGQPNRAPTLVRLWIESGLQLVDGAFLLPKLTWTKVSDESGFNSGELHKFDLLDITRIRAADTINRNKHPFASRRVSFVIETQTDVYLFEAETAEERDRVVYGLKVVVARLASLLMLRDYRAAEEFFGSPSNTVPGESPI